MWQDDYELAKPVQRKVSLLLRAQVLLGAGYQKFAWPFVFGGLSLLWLIGRFGGATTGALVLIGLFPLFGGLMIVEGLQKGLRAHWQIVHGLLTHGKRVNATAAETEAAGRYHALVYVFKDAQGKDQRLVRHVVGACGELLDDDEERFLYAPQDPSRGVLLDELPARGQVTPEGHWEANGSPVAGLVMPAATVLVHGGLLAYWLGVISF